MFCSHDNSVFASHLPLFVAVDAVCCPDPVRTCLPIPPHLSHLASPLQKVTHQPPLRKVIPTPRSVCMLTPLVSFQVLSILSQTVTGVVSTWLHFLKCGTSGSSGKQDGVGNRDAPSWLGLSVLPSGRREQGAACLIL